MYKCGHCGAEFNSEEEAESHMMKHFSEHMQKQQEVMTQTNLLLAASQLTQICLISGRKPREAIEVFTEVYELLKNWRSGVSSKEHFMKWLDEQWHDQPGQT